MAGTAKHLVGLSTFLIVCLGCGDDGGGEDVVDDAVDDFIDGEAIGDDGGDVEAETCLGCLIDGDCLAAAARNPGNPCQVCDPARDDAAWSGDDGAACDDGVHCNGEDSCGGGTCSVHAGDPCTDDGFFCNGTESCDEASAACVRSGNPCSGAGETCYESEDACCSPEAGRRCNADGDVVSVDSCGHEEGLLETCADIERALCLDGYCGCEPGFGGADCTGCVVYVSGDDGDDTADGRSWAAAKATVQAGLDLAATDGCEVWVAAAASPYLPTLGTGTRFLSIQLRSGVALYGGFAGDEAVREQRDPAANETVLSGDLGAAGVATDNACHVVTAMTIAAGTLIDGFTIREGQADCLDDGAGGALDWRAQQGGGMWVEGGNLTIDGCLFTANESISNGTLYVLDGTVSLSDSTFAGNTVVGGGGGVFVTGAAGVAVLSGCTLRDNTAGSGGAVYTHGGARADLTGCTLADNEVTVDGGGFFGAPSSPVALTDCTVSGNVAGGEGGGGAADTVTALRTVFSDNRAVTDGGGFAFQGDYEGLILERCLFHGNEAGGAGGGLVYDSCDEPVIRNCDIVANRAGVGGGGVAVLPNDCGSTPGFNSIVWANTAPVDPDCNACGGWPYSLVGITDPRWCYSAICEDPRLVNTDPALGPLDLHLLPTSPGIDAGWDDEATTADLEGRAWVDDPVTPNCDPGDPTAPECSWYSDIGAYEYVP